MGWLPRESGGVAGCPCLAGPVWERQCGWLPLFGWSRVGTPVSMLRKVSNIVFCSNTAISISVIIIRQQRA